MLMRPERDEGEQAEQGGGGAGDGLIGPLALGLDAEVATDLGEGDFGAPAASKPAQDIKRIGTWWPGCDQMAVPLTISTWRSVRPYQPVICRRCQRVSRLVSCSDRFGKRRPRRRGRPTLGSRGGGGSNRRASRRRRVMTQSWCRTALSSSMTA